MTTTAPQTPVKIITLPWFNIFLLSCVVSSHKQKTEAALTGWVSVGPVGQSSASQESRATATGGRWVPKMEEDKDDREGSTKFAFSAQQETAVRKSPASHT